MTENRVVSIKPEAIKDVVDRVYEFVQVPEWYIGEDPDERSKTGIWLRSLTPDEMSKYFDNDRQGKQEEAEGIARGLIVSAVEYPDGPLLYNKSHIPWLQQRNMAVLNRLNAVMHRLNGFDKRRTMGNA